MADLKLQALDSEDLTVVSALCQDAVVVVREIIYTARARRMALILNRFDWPAAQAIAAASSASTAGTGVAAPSRPYARRRSGLRFEQVERVQFSGFDPKSPSTVLSLLAIEFQPTDAPGGHITLQFAAGATLRLEVAYIEAELKDLGAQWSTQHRPDHGSDADVGPATSSASKSER